MKSKLTFAIIATLTLMCVLGLSSCDDKETSEPEPGALFTEGLSKSWVPETITLDDKDVTQAFTGFSLTFNANGTYTTTGTTLSVFQSVGVFAPLPGTDSPVLFDLLLDNNVTLKVDALSEQQLTFQLQYTGTTSRVSALSGHYHFTFKVK